MIIHFAFEFSTHQWHSSPAVSQPSKHPTHISTNNENNRTRTRCRGTQTERTAALPPPVAISHNSQPTHGRKRGTESTLPCLAVLPTRSMYTQGQNLEIFFAIAALPGPASGQLHLIALPQGLIYLL
uniref:(northern house mosquito) hypothetical protein n=1 Tax=Culex pipiens TaxID=7175 RepID=A0A8D8H5H9_CULPI